MAKLAQGDLFPPDLPPISPPEPNRYARGGAGCVLPPDYGSETDWTPVEIPEWLRLPIVDSGVTPDIET